MALALVGTRARAEPSAGPAVIAEGDRWIDLPVAGLRVRVPEALGAASIEVDSSWSEAMAWDRVTVGDMRYEVQVGARTARDCPMPEPFDVVIGGATWIRSRDRFCLLLPESRLLVRIDATSLSSGLDRDALDPHRPLLEALAEALTSRRLVPSGRRPPPPYDPLPESISLPAVGLELTRPDERARWHVAERRPERDFDALVREVPAYPEVQVSVRRHPRATIADCPRLFRALLAGPWRADALDPATLPALAGWQGVLGRRLGRYRSYMICRETADALLDLRIAVDPERDPRTWLDAVTPLIEALAKARTLHPPPASKALDAPVESSLLRSASLLLGASLPGTLTHPERSPRASAAPYAAVELGACWARRNHLAVGASVALGVDGQGPTWLGRFDLGVAVAIDAETTFVVAFGIEDRRDALVANRTLSTVFELRAREHEPHAFAWALRMQPLHIASREPAIRGAPLTLAWQGVWPSGLLVGVDLAWVAAPTRPSAAWPTEGLAFGLRLGWAELTR